MNAFLKQTFYILVLTFFSVAAPALSEEVTVRIGHFPNLTHAHGLIAHNQSRSSNGWFESRAGTLVKVEWFTYNAGPSAMEALLLGSIDFAYVGPNPALNAYSKTKGTEVRILAGATTGGAALVVQSDGGIMAASDFKNKKIATPQLGNTQDIAARAWFIKNGLPVTQTGGDVRILPTENPDQLALFQAKQIDGAWTVEPWVTRLETEAGGKIFLEEKEAITTVFIASTKIIKEKPDLVKAFLMAHEELSAWIAAHPAEAQAQIMAELQAETGKAVNADLIKHAWPRMRFSAELPASQLTSFVDSAKQVGFLKDVGNLDGIFYK